MDMSCDVSVETGAEEKSWIGEIYPLYKDEKNKKEGKEKTMFYKNIALIRSFLEVISTIYSVNQYCNQLQELVFGVRGFLGVRSRESGLGTVLGIRQKKITCIVCI